MPYDMSYVSDVGPLFNVTFYVAIVQTASDECPASKISARICLATCQSFYQVIVDAFQHYISGQHSSHPVALTFNANTGPNICCDIESNVKFKCLTHYVVPA